MEGCANGQMIGQSGEETAKGERQRPIRAKGKGTHASERQEWKPKGQLQRGNRKVKGSSRRAQERLVSHLTGRKTAKACHIVSYKP
jgi:hypothetical protein